MTRITIAIAIAFAAIQSSADADSRIAKLCGPDHVNEVASLSDVQANPDGYYVASLREQISFGDRRIVLTPGDEFYLCTRQAATPEMDASKVLLLMDERTVKYLFVPTLLRDTHTSS